MTFSDKSYNLRIELDAKNYECSAQEIARMEQALDPLSRATQNFPVSDLYVTIIHHARTGDFHVKTSLVLTGRTLFTGERGRDMYAAYEECISKLVRKISAYKSAMSGDAEHSRRVKGTDNEIVPSQAAEHAALRAAVDNQDYQAFRDATMMYEEAVRKRIGRWIQRYPELDAAIGDRIQIGDLLEDVFLTAFERFDERPQNVPPAEWLEHLIDDVVRNFAAHPDEEMENIDMVRSARDAENEQ